MPKAGAAGFSLRHDALAAEPAALQVDDVAVGEVVLVDSDAR